MSSAGHVRMAARSRAGLKGAETFRVTGRFGDWPPAEWCAVKQAPHAILGL